MTEFQLPTVQIHGLGSGGDGVGRLADGRVVFVPETLPGDRVRIRLGEQRKRVQYADLVEVLEPSEHRIPSRCDVERCGGCPLRGSHLPAQGAMKRQRVIANLKKVGKLDVGELLGSVRQIEPGWEYRHRVRLHAAFIQGRWALGYYARRSRALVPLSECPVLWPELLSYGRTVVESLELLPPELGLESLELVYSRRDERGACRMSISGSVERARHWLRMHQGTTLNAFEIVNAKQRYRYGNLTMRYDHADADAFDLRFEPGIFTQAHVEMNKLLVSAAVAPIRASERPKVLELHAGIGNFTVPMMRAGAAVTAVEQNPRAAHLCQRNLRSAGQAPDVRTASDADAVQDMTDFNLVFLDPPRTGAREVCEALADRGPSRVVYVSCDAATFARDARILADGRYRIGALQAFDMFPQTPHVELLGVFERDPPKSHEAAKRSGFPRG